MGKVLAVAGREIREKSFTFLFALFLTVAPALVLVNGGFARKVEGVALLTMILGTSFVAGLAAVLGASLIGREMRERRLSFYLARPLAVWQLWTGKLLGAVLTLAGCAAILFTPLFLIYPQSFRSAWDFVTWNVAGIFILLCVVLMLVIHAGATMIRSRSPWLGLDFVGIVVVAGVTAAAVLPLVLHSAAGLVVIILGAVAVTAVAALLVGGGVQLARGRVDVRAQHRALSLTLWGAVGAAAFIALAVSIWARSATVHDLVAPLDAQGEQPSLIQVSGRARYRAGYRASFFIDPRSGRTTDAGALAFGNSVPSAHGRSYAWIEPNSKDLLMLAFSGRRRFGGEVRVVTRAGDGRFVRRATGIDVPASAALAVSDDGKRLAVFDGTVAVYDLDEGRVQAAVRLPAAGGAPLLQFLDDGRLRIATFSNARGSADNLANARVYDFEASAKRLTTVFTRSANSSFIRAASSPDGGRIWIWRSRPFDGTAPYGSRAFVDVASGREVILSGSSPAVAVRGIAPLADGRIAGLGVLSRRGAADEVSLLVWSADGTLLRESLIATGSWARNVREVAPGKLSAVLNQGRDTAAFVIDVDRGVVLRRRALVRGVRPTFSSFFGTLGPADSPEIPLLTGEGLILWNAVTGAEKKVL